MTWHEIHISNPGTKLMGNSKLWVSTQRMGNLLTNEYLCDLVRELCKLPFETEWVEFKRNCAENQRIGEYISALSNSAVLAGEEHAYVLWGVDDKTHKIVGTSFNPNIAKEGNEDLENWLSRQLTPRIYFHFHSLCIDGHSVVLLRIHAAFSHPVRFVTEEFIRVGSHTKRLREHPEKERELWRKFEQRPFESRIAAEHLTADEVLKLLDYPSYFELSERTLPDSKGAILDALAKENLLVHCEAGGWNITALGAVLFAKRLDVFPELKRKATRIVHYKGRGRSETLREYVHERGYAAGFESLIAFIMNLVPTQEIIGPALRRTVPMFPRLAVRELVANALIHQDFFATGTGPMIEIFADRMEMNNPGTPLIDILRFVDSPPKSRNDTLASLMRRLGICEEQGSGIDKVVEVVESNQLPAPRFEAPDGFTRAVLFAHKALAEMDKEERVQACYLHACLKRVMNGYLTNASLRERFRVEAKNKAAISRYIREALDEKVIKAFDADAAKKSMKYVPFWA